MFPLTWHELKFEGKFHLAEATSSIFLDLRLSVLCGDKTSSSLEYTAFFESVKRSLDSYCSG